VFHFEVARSKLDPTLTAQQPSWALVFLHVTLVLNGEQFVDVRSEEEDEKE
jgi:hypothetical protein